jgi:hypothetical protein
MLKDNQPLAGARCATPDGLYDVVDSQSLVSNGDTVVDFEDGTRQAILLPSESIVNVDRLLNDSRPAALFDPGSRITTKDGFGYVVADASATHPHLTTPGGLKLYAVPADSGTVSARQLGLNVSGGPGSAAAINALAPSLTSSGIFEISFGPTDVLLVDVQLHLAGLVLSGTCNAEGRGQGSTLRITAGRDPSDPAAEAAIAVHARGGVRGFKITYPEQVTASSSSPTPYSWAVSTAKAATGRNGNSDGVQFSDLFFENAYRALDLTNAAQYRVKNIFGTPLYRGLLVDQMLDVGSVERIHWWPFYATKISNLGKWIAENCIGFSFGRVDNLQASELFSYGQQCSFHFFCSKGLGKDGYAWIQGINWLSDVCDRPFWVEDGANMLALQNLTVTTDTQQALALDVNGTIQRAISISNLFAYGDGTACLGRINSTGGRLVINGLEALGANANDFNRGLYVQEDSTTSVSITCAPELARYISGFDTVSVNGVRYPAKGDPLISQPSGHSNLRLENWTDGEPDGWTMKSGWSGSRTAKRIAGGMRVHLESNNGANLVSYMDHDIAKLREAPSPKLLTFRLKASPGTAVVNSRLVVEFRNSSGSEISYKFNFDSMGFFAEPTTVVLPVIYNASGETGSHLLRLTYHAYGSCNFDLDITDLDLVHFDRGSDPRYLELARMIWAKAPEAGPRLEGGRFVEYRDAAPTSGGWIAGDKILFPEPTAGGSIGAVCTTSGEPGTWMNFGGIDA